MYADCAKNIREVFCLNYYANSTYLPDSCNVQTTPCSTNCRNDLTSVVSIVHVLNIIWIFKKKISIIDFDHNNYSPNVLYQSLSL